MMIELPLIRPDEAKPDEPPTARATSTRNCASEQRSTLLETLFQWRCEITPLYSANLPFIVIDAAGLGRIRDSLKQLSLTVIFLTGMGSSYYHWHPNGATLFRGWLPMTRSFATVLKLGVAEDVNEWQAFFCGHCSLSDYSAQCCNADLTI
jgi:hypothetical protein